MSAIFIFLGALFWVVSVYATYVQIPRAYVPSKKQRFLASIRVNVLKAIREHHSLGLFAAAFQSFSLYLIVMGCIMAAAGDERIAWIPPELIILLCAVVPAVLGTLMLSWLVRRS